jgi:hypothetical protein
MTKAQAKPNDPPAFSEEHPPEEEIAHFFAQLAACLDEIKSAAVVENLPKGAV